MKKYLILLIISGCGGNGVERGEENIPPVLIQVWDQSQCKICKDPTMSLSGIGLTSVDLSKESF